MEKERKKFEDYVEMFGEHRFNREVSSKMNLAVDKSKTRLKGESGGQGIYSINRPHRVVGS